MTRRYTWEYQRTRWGWSGDYGPWTPLGGLRHEMGWWALTERGIRRKLARKIRRERRRKTWEDTKVTSERPR